MATIVNLNLGGTEGGVTASYELILASPYTEPSPYLLVLRSAPDIPDNPGTLVATERSDTALSFGIIGTPPDLRTGTLKVTEARDTGTLLATAVPPPVDGVIVAVSPDDSALVVGSYDGVTPRVATLSVIEQNDTSVATGTYTLTIVAVVEGAETSDTADLPGGFTEYTSPGFVLVTERSDSAVIYGYSVYDITSTIEATETADTALLTAVTAQYYEAPLLADAGKASDVLGGDVSSTLHTNGRATDTLEGSVDAYLFDQAVATDTLDGVLRMNVALSDTAKAQDSLGTAGFIGISSDTALASDSLGAIRYGVTNDVAKASDTLSGVYKINDALTTAGTASDTIQAYFTGVLSDAAITSDSLLGEIASKEGLIDIAVASDTLAAELTSTDAVRSDLGVARDVLDSIFLAASGDSANSTDDLGGNISTYAPLDDNAVADDILDGDLVVYAPSLEDTGIASDALGGYLEIHGILSDTALAGDTLFEAAQTIYVVNAETGAVSTYTFTPTVRSAMDYQGVLYLAGPEGLYAVDAERDEDGAIVWTLRTGFNNMGSDRLKRIRDINFQARTEGDTTVQVVSDRYGDKQEWNYRLPPLTRNSYRDGVVKIGKGLHSVYWQVAARGVGPSEIDQMRLYVESLSRRR